MNHTEQIALLKERFVNVESAYARQWYNPNKGGGYYPVRHGACPLTCGTPNCRHRPTMPLTDNHIMLHLKGEETIGVYQLDEQNTVKWMCFDIDINKGGADDPLMVKAVKEHTLKMAYAFAAVIPRSFIVEWSGSRGYHIWAFFDEPVPASKAVPLADYLGSLVTPPDGIHVEVFPKQSRMKSFGNLVKLPLGLHRKTEERSVFVKADFTPQEDQWGVLRNVVVLSESDLDTLISTLGLIEKPIETYTEPFEGIGDYVPVCLHRVLAEGADEGGRDEAAWRVASYLRYQGLPRYAAEAVLDAWNRERNDPPLDLVHLERKVESAFSNSYGFRPCGVPSLDNFCSSRCKYWDGKLERRWKGRDPRTAIGRISRD